MQPAAQNRGRVWALGGGGGYGGTGAHASKLSELWRGGVHVSVRVQVRGHGTDVG